MPSTVFPVACSFGDWRQHFGGLEDALELVVSQSGKDEEALYQQYCRAAQGDLAERTGMPFFVTRYCTRELARQLGLTQGAAVDGYDRRVVAQDYNVYDWLTRTGRTELGLRPLQEVEAVRFTTASDGQLYDLPIDWLNLDEDDGAFHVLPNPGGSAAVLSRVTGIYPGLRGAQTNLPLLIHCRFTAGLVEVDYADLDAYDPDLALEQTGEDPDLVVDYQQQIAALGAAKALLRLVNAHDAGGSSVSFDGLSQSVDPKVLLERLKFLQDEVAEWVARHQGLKIAFV